MKFYYNGRLVRTSKTHEYTHAVIDTITGGCKGCRVGKDKAEAIISAEVAEYERRIKNYESAIKALESGKSGYYVKEGRRTWFNKFSTDATVEKYRKWIAWNVEYVNSVKASWRVVELESRA